MMGWLKEDFGQTPDGKQVYQYTLTNKNGLRAGFLNLGGIWRTMETPDREGKLADIVLGYDEAAAYLNSPAHLGEIVGRNANRIGGSVFTLQGKEYRLTANDGDNNLHSGEDYFRSRIWQAEVKEGEEGTTVAFSLESPDGDQGYPGNMKITVSYTLTDRDELRIRYQAAADHDTLMNMTNHSYFNLAGHDKGSAVSQEVELAASHFTPADAHSIPTGEILPVQGTPMDFTRRKAIGEEIDRDYEQLVFGSGYDHNWVIDGKPGELRLAARAWDRESGRAMEVYTDLPGIQFYTGNYLDNSLPGKGGAVYGRRHGYCFETQYYPDGINKPQFPSPVLAAGREGKTETVFRFFVS